MAPNSSNKEFRERSLIMPAKNTHFVVKMGVDMSENVKMGEDMSEND